MRGKGWEIVFWFRRGKGGREKMGRGKGFCWEGKRKGWRMFDQSNPALRIFFLRIPL